MSLAIHSNDPYQWCASRVRLHSVRIDYKGVADGLPVSRGSGFIDDADSIADKDNIIQFWISETSHRGGKVERGL
jgi:hypothetical protein